MYYQTDEIIILNHIHWITHSIIKIWGLYGKDKWFIYFRFFTLITGKPVFTEIKGMYRKVSVSDLILQARGS